MKGAARELLQLRLARNLVFDDLLRALPAYPQSPEASTQVRREVAELGGCGVNSKTI